MGKSDDAKMAKLVRKLSQQAGQAKGVQRRKYDDTLRPETDVEGDLERKAFFKEMKKREF